MPSHPPNWNQELDDILESLQIWPMMQTTVVPLTTFAGRRDAGREGWKVKYGVLDDSEAKRLRELEDENRQLERLVAELTPATGR